MNLPIVDIPEYFYFISPFVVTALGFICSLLPYCFFGKKALISIPLILIPILGIVLTTPASLLSVVLSEYLAGLVLGSVTFFVLYKNSKPKNYYPTKSLYHGTVAITTGPLAPKDIKIFYQGADQLPEIIHDSTDHTG